MWAVAAVLGLAGCTGGPAAPVGGSTSTVPSSTAASPSESSVTRDGRTILPAVPDDCSTPTADDVRSRLGSVAASVQTPQASASTKDGVSTVTCVYSLIPVPVGQMPDPGNALVLTTTKAPDSAGIAALGLPRLMMSPEPVEGAGERAWFGVNRLSATTEYVFESVQGLTAIRASLGVPSSTPEVGDAKQRLQALLSGL